MKRTLKHRVVAVLIAISVGTGIGALAGHRLAVAIALKVTELKLQQYAGSLLADGESSSAELRTVLSVLGSSGKPACSDAEIAYFRAVIFESDFLKDAGRMTNGKIQCSAAMGKHASPRAQPEPEFRQQDGTEVYLNLTPYRTETERTTIAVAQSGFYLVFTPITRIHLEPEPMHFTVTAIDAPAQRPGRLLGELPEVRGDFLTRDGTLREGQKLYATHCSIRFFTCFTAYADLSKVIQANRTKYSGCIAACALGGGLCGLLVSLLYRRNKSLEQQLLRAIRAENLWMAYQPIVDLRTGRIVGAEALIRWSDEDGIPVKPEVFVKIAEERGFVGEITRLVVKRVLRELGETLWQLPGFRLSINVAAADLTDPRFLILLDNELEKSGVPARSLAIEITEGSTARHDVAMETIRQLRRRGHSVHIDDFGTGYSSLAYLHELAVNAIKIDKAFTQAVGTGAVIVAILPQILAMAQALNLEVIVEGVETAEQAEFFAGVEQAVLVQGWLFGQPSLLPEFLKLLAEDSRKFEASAGSGTAPHAA